MRQFFLSLTPLAIALTGLFLSSETAKAAEKPLTGQQIFAQTCAGCHGEKGEGTDVYEKPLAGELSVSQLADRIQKTMPEDDPGSLGEEESKLVAQYVYDTFYSAIARQRNAPARIELARLTVRQYRLAVADLIGSFREPQVWGEERGLSGEYYQGRRTGDRRRRKESRLDPQVDFHFGTEAPVKSIETPHEFSIRWEGSVLAPETGQYRFMVRTEHALRLWVNDDETPLIDAWVKSGDGTEFESDLFLVGGRIYPLKLEFSKAKQGVDDSDKQKGPPPSKPASISLLWKRPSGELETIPSRNLSPNETREVFVCSVPFPPDDRSYGWERGTAISEAWQQATTEAAIQTAGYVTANLNSLTGTRDDDKDREERVKAFCRSFADRAFRRPLTESQAKWLIDRQFSEAKDLENAVKRVVLLTLKSPRFLYREVGGPDQFDVASRLAFGLWDSIPDETLLKAAREGQLATKEQVAAQAERMLNDPRAKTKIREFLLAWLNANTETDVGKDPKKYPGFDQALAFDMRTSLELFLDDVVWSEDSDYRKLLLSEEVYLNERLAKFFEVSLGETKDFVPVKLDEGKRAGILTHPYLMARFANEAESSPIHRGVFVVRGLLGHALRPPPEAVAPLPAELHPSLTTRERVVLQTSSASCMTCHDMINPLGFPFERFDAVGRYREKDQGKPINDVGSYHTRSGEEKTFHGTKELAAFLAQSEESHSAFAEQFFHHLVQQSIGAYGPNVQNDLTKQFAADKFHIRKLAVRIMAESALIGRETELAKNTKK